MSSGNQAPPFARAGGRYKWLVVGVFWCVYFLNQADRQVIFSSVMPVSNYGARPMTDRRPPAKILALNAWLKAYCQAGNCTYLDYFSSMVDDKGFLRPELSGDGLHPNAAGYKLMAPLAETAIRNVVK